MSLNPLEAEQVGVLRVEMEFLESPTGRIAGGGPGDLMLDRVTDLLGAVVSPRDVLHLLDHAVVEGKLSALSDRQVRAVRTVVHGMALLAAGC